MQGQGAFPRISRCKSWSKLTTCRGVSLCCGQSQDLSEWTGLNINPAPSRSPQQESVTTPNIMATGRRTQFCSCGNWLYVMVACKKCNHGSGQSEVPTPHQGPKVQHQPRWVFDQAKQVSESACHKPSHRGRQFSPGW